MQLRLKAILGDVSFHFNFQKAWLAGHNTPSVRQALIPLLEAGRSDNIGLLNQPHKSYA
jgi:hypothetical protein